MKIIFLSCFEKANLSICGENIFAKMTRVVERIKDK